MNLNGDIYTMIDILKAIGWVAASLFVCYNTNAVYEYLKLLPIPNRITKIKDYLAESKWGFQNSYKVYMMANHDSFLIRMMTCYYCFGVWLSLAFSAYFSCLEWLPVVYLGSLSTYLGCSVAFKKLGQMEQTNE